MAARKTQWTFVVLTVLLLAVTVHSQPLDTLKIKAEADGLAAQAEALKKTGQTETALQVYQSALEKYREIGDRSQEAELFNRMGSLYKLIGNYTRALDFFKSSLALNKELKDLRGECLTNMKIGAVYYAFGDDPKVLEIFRQSLQISRELADQRVMASALQGLAVMYFVYLHDTTQALQSFKEALTLYQTLGDSERIGLVHLNLGRAYTGLGDSVLACEHYREGLEIARALGNMPLECDALYKMSYDYYLRKKYDQAIGHYQEALTLAQTYKSPEDVIHILQGIGLCYASMGADSLALEYYAKCVEQCEKIRSRLQMESQKHSWASNISELYADLIPILLKNRQIAAAFNYCERGRARAFLDLLAGNETKIGKAQHREFLAREQDYQKHKQEITGQATVAGEDTTKSAALRGKLTEEWETALAALEETKREQPELASLVSVNPLTLPEVQKLLDRETTLLEYFLTEKKTLIWLVTRKQVEVFQVEIGGDSLKSLVMDFRKTIENRGKTEELSRQLYDLLVAPAAEKIKTVNLIVVPHGILHYLPFAALQNEKGHCLLEDYRIRYLPSASVLKYLPAKRQDQGESLLALGNPATDRKGYNAIPLTETEVREIGSVHQNSQVLSGAQATETNFKRLASQCEVLHLACHGDLNSAYPMYSCLLLAPDSSEDGELDVHEIFNLDLNASLVVLSGCQTGLGHLTNGDELVGLSRAFIYAGTPSIVSSLWMVEDESTAYLMGRFYHHLQRQDKAEALRQAQLETRQKYPSLRSWASFVLTGDSM